MFRLTVCPEPECGAVAEIFDSVTLGSTHGGLEHVRTRCLSGHVFVLPAERLVAPGPLRRPAPGPGRRAQSPR